MLTNFDLTHIKDRRTDKLKHNSCNYWSKKFSKFISHTAWVVYPLQRKLPKSEKTLPPRATQVKVDDIGLRFVWSPSFIKIFPENVG